MGCMKLLRIDAKFTREFALNGATLEYLRKKKIKTVAIYSSVQFIHQLPKILQQLDKIHVKHITSKPSRTAEEYQILGCDAYHENLHLKIVPDIFLYIGDGMFHPRALLLMQKDLSRKDFREILIYNPPEDRMEVLGLDDVKRILKKYRVALMKFLSSENIGCIITVKPGQQHLGLAQTLAKKFPNKKVYYFVDDTVSMLNLQQYPFIQVWVNTACPRMGFDDAAEISSVILNATDALHAEEILGKESVMNSL
jgi:diphthamide biosynthesis enzyme Dph1/Dph2-like protein